MYTDTSPTLESYPRKTIDGIPVDVVADLDAEFWELASRHDSGSEQPLVDDFV